MATDDDATALPPGIDNETRRQVFLTLVEAGHPMTPTAIADATEATRELVHHHLTKLVEMGLVVRSDGEYRCQPVFTDPSFQEAFVGHMAELMPEVAERIDIEAGAEAEAVETAVFNCLKMSIALHLLPPEAEEA